VSWKQHRNLVALCVPVDSIQLAYESGRRLDHDVVEAPDL
jgi:hypothetical protein